MCLEHRLQAVFCCALSKVRVPTLLEVWRITFPLISFSRNVKPLTITRLERRTVSLDDVKKAVLNEFENDLRFRKFHLFL